MTPLSDTIDGGATNHYDARFLVYRDRLFVHYNNDWNTVPNQIHLVEFGSRYPAGPFAGAVAGTGRAARPLRKELDALRT